MVMATVNKVILAVCVLLLAELLYAGVEGGTWPTDDGEHHMARLSFGLPFRSVEWTTADLDEVLDSVHPERDEWDAGVEIRTSLLVCDLLFAVLVGLLLVILIPNSMLISLIQIILFGLATGAIVFHLDGMSPFGWSTIVIAAVALFLGAPLAIHRASRRIHRPFPAMVLLSFIVLLAFFRGGTIVGALTKGSDVVMEPLEWLCWLACVALVAVLVAGECLVVRVLCRKFRPASVERLAPVEGAQITLASADSEPRPTPRRTGMAARRKWVALVLVLLMMTAWIGCHFVMVERLRGGAFADGRQEEGLLDVFDRCNVSDLILSELSSLAKPLADGGSSVSMESVSESFAGRFHASYRLRAEVNNEDVYDFTVTKHILVPWFRLKTEKVDAGLEELESR